MKYSLWLCVLALGALAIGSGPVAAAPLYAGTSSSGIVYQYVGDTTWDAISPSLGYAVLDLVEYQGKIYAGTMSSSPSSGVGKVWRYDGDGLWTLIGNNLDDQVCDLVVYNGDLYAGTAWDRARIYRYDGGTTWTMVVDYGPWEGMRALYVAADGYLHCGDIHYDKFGRFDGTNFYEDYPVVGGSCIYDFAEYGGALYGSAYVGRMWKSTDGVNWAAVLGYYDGNMWELEVFQGLLFMSYNNGELQSTDSTIGRDPVWTAPDGIISMLARNDTALFFGTGGEAGAGYGSETSGTGVVYCYDGASTPDAISGTLGVGVQTLLITCWTVDIDIKPGGDPNAINLGSAGVIPVAILGSETFDATAVDPSTVCLAGASVKLIGKGDKYSASIEDVNGDGYDDLVCRVETASFLVEPGSSTAVLEAETYDGWKVCGEDSITIVPPE